jgi:hypothetical protein
MKSKNSGLAAIKADLPFFGGVGGSFSLLFFYVNRSKKVRN